MYSTANSVVNLRAFANNFGLPLAALLDVRPHQDLQLPQIARGPAPPRCRNCRAFWSQYCMVNLPKQMWHCACCGVGNISKSALQNPDPTSYPELYNETVEYRVLHQSEQQPPQVSRRKHIVLAVDGTLDAPLLASLRATILETLKVEVTPDTLISVIAFDGAVVVLDLASGRQHVSSWVLSGSTLLDQTGRDSLAQPDRAFSVEQGKCANRLAEALSSIRAFETGKPMRIRSRCFTVAIEAGLELLSKHAVLANDTDGTPCLAPGSKLLVFLGGPVTKGPGFVPITILDGLERPSKAQQKQMKEDEAHMEQLASIAASLNVGIDVFLGAEAGVNVALLNHLVDGSQGGQLHMQRGFGPSFGMALKACLSSCFGTQAIMDVFCSDGLQLVQCMGALDEKQKLGAPMSPSGPWTSPSACYVGSLVAGRGIVARFELTQDLPCSDPDKPSFAHVQVVLYYRALHTNELVARVSSKRLNVVPRASQFLRSVDAHTSAIVAAKRLLLDARSTGALSGDPKKLESARLAVSAQASLIATRLGKEVQVSSGLLGIGARKQRQWPPELLRLALGLYNLQRSCMLAGPPMSHAQAVHPDERLLLMLQLLSAGHAASLAQLFPTLYAVLPEQQSLPKDGLNGPTLLPGQSATVPSPAAATPAKEAISAGAEAGGVQLALVDVRAALDVVGMSALQARHGGNPPDGQAWPSRSLPPLLLDLGPTLILVPPSPPQPYAQHDSIGASTAAIMDVALAAASQQRRTPQLLTVQAKCPVGQAQDGAPFVPSEFGQQGAPTAAAKEVEFLSALQPVCKDAWQHQQVWLNSEGGLAWMFVRDEAHAAALSGELQHRLGVTGPDHSFVQWGKAMGIMMPSQ